MTPLASWAALAISIAIGWPAGRLLERALAAYVARLERRN
jgi:hypothetical protein